MKMINDPICFHSLPCHNFSKKEGGSVYFTIHLAFDLITVHWFLLCIGFYKNNSQDNHTFKG